MSAIVPGAGDVRTFWENTLHGIDAITEVPADRWDWRLYYDADPKAPDKITSKWGGFVPEIAFDPLRYGMPPTSLPSIEPLHLLTLEAVRAAIDDAGYRDRPFAR
jgi:acyl transferase domain-containing protein